MKLAVQSWVYLVVCPEALAARTADRHATYVRNPEGQRSFVDATSTRRPEVRMTPGRRKFRASSRRSRSRRRAARSMVHPHPVGARRKLYMVLAPTPALQCLTVLRTERLQGPNLLHPQE